MRVDVSSSYRFVVSSLASHFVVAAHNRAEGREYVEQSRRRWLVTQSVSPSENSVWDRPIQEVELR
jgi:hypothetical protein